MAILGLRDVLPAHDIDDYVRLVDGLLREPRRAADLGRAGRQRVLAVYSWAARLAALDGPLAEVCSRVRPRSAPVLAGAMP